MIDYETLRIIWWLLIGVLITGFAVTDGFDFGVAMLVPLIGRNDVERRIMINSIGPVWEGNQVWIILGAGAIFAAWPLVYSVAFSGFYFAMLLALLGFILRPVGFKYRSKIPSTTWRNTWDAVIFLGGFVPPFVFGIAIGNVLQGVPFYFDETLRPFYTGNFEELFNPFALACGALSIAMFLFHGSIYLGAKTENHLANRTMAVACAAGLVVIVIFAFGGYWAKYFSGYTLLQVVSPEGFSNPLMKQVGRAPGAWRANFAHYHWMVGAPALGLFAPILAMLLVLIKRFKFALFFSGLSIIGIIGTVGLSMFPFILPSSTHPTVSLLVWDASSSQLTLFIMLLASIVFLPLIVLYTTWVYRVLRGKVSAETVAGDTSSY